MVLKLLAEAKSCILLTKYNNRFLDTPKLDQLKVNLKTVRYPLVDVLTRILEEKQEIFPHEKILLQILKRLETPRNI